MMWVSTPTSQQRSQMLLSTSSRIESGFQQLLPVELPPRVQPREEQNSPARHAGPAKGDITLGWGLLSRLCSSELVDRVLREQDRQEQRVRLLPARLVVYGLLLMCMGGDLSYAKLMHHLGGLAGAGRNWGAADKSAFVRARRRLGWEVMEKLFRALARPLGDADRDDCCFWRGLRVVVLDGTTFELPRNPELEAAFGGQRANDGSRRRVGPPLVRVVSLAECGTRALLDVAIGAYHIGENTLARQLRNLGPGRLVLADRGFPSKPLWEAYSRTGADLLWRAKSSIARRHLRWLPDGTYLVSFGKRNPQTVRVIEYRIGGSKEVYRLLTTLLDPASADALELARLYSERWETETLNREIKSDLCRDGRLRSQNEMGVRQELWATFIVHTLARQLAYQAASEIPERDPDRISFSMVKDTIRRSIGRLTVVGRRALDLAIGELTKLTNLVTRRPRSCPRAVYKRVSGYRSRALLDTPRSAIRPPIEIRLDAA
jgi:Insertion element 4 transposase N-terminal/Transposase DDE domain